MCPDWSYAGNKHAPVLKRTKSRLANRKSQDSTLGKQVGCVEEHPPQERHRSPVHLSFLDKMISRLRPKKYITVEECPSRGSRMCRKSRGEEEHGTFRKWKLFVVKTWKGRWEWWEMLLESKIEASSWRSVSYLDFIQRPGQVCDCYLYFQAVALAPVWRMGWRSRQPIGA